MHDVIAPIQPTLERSDRGDAIGVWLRRAGMCVLLAVIVVALFNVVGQRAGNATVRSSVADLSVRAPSRVRPGLLYQTKVIITAHERLSHASLRLGSGWIDGLTLNTEEPGASTETSGPNGSLVLSLGQLAAGQTFVQYLDYQVNPTSISSRSQTVAVISDGAVVVSLNHELTVIP
jgi:hypothetical protein